MRAPHDTEPFDTAPVEPPGETRTNGSDTDPSDAPTLRDDPDALLGGLPKARAVKVKPVRTASTSGQEAAAYDVGVITLDPGVITPPPEPPVLLAASDDADRDASTAPVR